MGAERIGRTIREARASITPVPSIRRIATEMDAPKSYYSKIESGYLCPKPGKLIWLERRFNLGEGSLQKMADEAVELLDDELVELLVELAILLRRDKNRVVKTIICQALGVARTEPALLHLFVHEMQKNPRILGSLFQALRGIAGGKGGNRILRI